MSAANDAQTPATAVTVQSGTPFDYVFRVTNNGPSATSTATAVSDTSLPTGVTLQGLPTGSGWTCGLAVGGFTCTRSDSLASGGTFPDITARVVHTGALPTAPLINTARVVNVNEDPTNNYGNNNSDPAHITLVPSATLCVPGTTVGNQTAPITATTPNLCPIGQTVGNFTAIQSPTTGVFTYTWSCN